MREFTRFLKEESCKDKTAIFQHNNSKERNRTPEQNEQSRRDRRNYYRNKWNELLKKCETKAQRDCCHDVLCRIHHIR